MNILYFHLSFYNMLFLRTIFSLVPLLLVYQVKVQTALEHINFEKVNVLWRPRREAQWTPERKQRSVPFAQAASAWACMVKDVLFAF